MNSTTPLPIEETSQSLGSGSEVTMIMPIKPGFVPHRDTITYALRLRRVLRTFNALRKLSLEASPHDTIVGAVERIQTVTSFNWAVVENQTKLLLTVVFDRPWEPYIRKIARDAGPMLDLILCNCAGYVEGRHSTDNGYPGFAAWVRKHQVGVDFLYTSHAHSTVDDQSYYEQLDQLLHDSGTANNFDLAATTLRAGSPSERAEKRATSNFGPYVEQLAAVICAFHAMREFFPGDAAPFPADGSSKDQWFLKRVARGLVDPIIKPEETAKLLEVACRVEYAWFKAPLAEAPSPRAAPRPSAPQNIQGNILEAYQGMMHGALLLIRLGESRGQSFEYLKKLSEQITTAGSNPPVEARNLFFTIEGLRRLGLQATWIAKLPKEFRDGMEARAGLLGDVRSNHPRSWLLPTANGPLLPDGVKFRVPLQSVDIAVLLQRKDDSLKQSIDEIADQARQYGACVLYFESMYKSPGGVEHFGYKDGISNPLPESGAEPAAGAYSDEVPFGEFLLGYPNRYNDPVEAVDPSLKDGSFMVVRKLAKDTKSFGELMQSFQDKHSGVGGAALAKAKLMGRKPDGTPLASVGGTVATQATNDFTFTDDPPGALCPLQSHIRRANPRCPIDGSPTVPRIARRGFSYGLAPGSTAEGERGAIFMAYNASIAEQFEIIQRWMSGGNSTAISSRESDPVLGLPKPGESRSVRFQDNGKVYRIDLGSGALVTLKWGLYLFCPSISLIKSIASGGLNEKNPDIETQGAGMIRGLMASPRSEEIPPGFTESQIIAARWKAFLEGDLGQRAPLMNAVWAAIRRDHKGVLRTPYGTLVAGAEQVRVVLGDDGQLFSVRENWNRMQGSIAETYLGIDACPARMIAPSERKDTELEQRYLAACPAGGSRYADEANLSKPRVSEVKFKEAYEKSYAIAQPWLAASLGASPKPVIQVPELFGHVLAALSRTWFGMPDGKKMVASVTPEGTQGKAACPFHFFAVSKYVFPPQPIPFVNLQATDHGKLIRDAVLEFVKDPASVPGTLLSAIYAMEDEKLISRTIITLLNGFVAPTFANFLTIMNRWMEFKELAREYHRYQLAPGDSTALRLSVERALLVKCTPATVNRTVVRKTKLPGRDDLELMPGEQVVVGLQSAVDERRFAGDDGLEFVFGGYFPAGMHYPEPDAKVPVHACPGRDMAIGVMAGTLRAIFDAHLITDTGMPLTLRPNPPPP